MQEGLVRVSVIIPTFNEEKVVGNTLRWLRNATGRNHNVEVIIADGGSTDQTIAVAKREGANVVNSRKGRAVQMNEGAKAARGEILYFLHADTRPPALFLADIQNAISEGYGAGCYRLSFDHDHWFLKANCWFTRFDVDAIRFGDQSLFVRRNIFLDAGGFSEKHLLLEDQDMVKRLKRLTRFTVRKKAVISSARKYVANGVYKTQAVFFVIYFLYRMGLSQTMLVRLYRSLIRQDKL